MSHWSQRLARSRMSILWTRMAVGLFVAGAFTSILWAQDSGGPVGPKLQQARVLAPTDARQALLLLAECMDEADSGDLAADVADLGIEILRKMGKYAEAIQWCDWGLERGRYFGLDAARLRGLEDLKKGLQAALKKEKRERKIREQGEDAVLFAEAKRLELSGQRKAALAKYEQLRDRFPQSEFVPPSVTGSGRCLLWLWRNEECVALLTEFVKKDPSGAYRDQAHLVLGDVALLGYCQGLEARRFYERAAQLAFDGRSTGSDTAWRAEQRLAIVSYVLGDAKNALEKLKNSRRLIPQDEDTDLAQESFGLEVLESWLEQGEGPTPAWVNAEGGPNARTALLLGDLWRTMLDFEKALAALGLVLDPKLLGRQATNDQRAYALMQRGLIEDNTFQAENSERSYTEVLKNYSSSRVVPQVKLRLGCLLFNQTERHFEASRILEALADKHPHFPQAEYALYMASWQRAVDGDEAEAKRMLVKLQRWNPNSIWISPLKSEIEIWLARRK